MIQVVHIIACLESMKSVSVFCNGAKANAHFFLNLLMSMHNKTPPGHFFASEGVLRVY